MISVLGKLPPQDVELEQAILGAVMLERMSIVVVSQILRSEDFYKDVHKEIYRAIEILNNKAEPIDIKTVTHQLRAMGKLEFVGGPYYVAELTSKVNSAANIDYHCRIVKQASMKRQIIGICNGGIKDGYENTVDVFQLLDRLQSELLRVNNLKGSTQKLSDLIQQGIEDISDRKRKREQSATVGLATGLRALDRRTGGFSDGDLIIVAARPGMGKTALINTLLINVGVNQNLPCGFASMEMTNHQTTLREISNESEVSINRILNGNIEDSELEAIIHKSSRLLKGTILMDERPALTPMQLRNLAYAWKIQYDIKLFMVDYLQIGGGNENDSKEQQVSKYSSTCKQIAKELKIPVVALSQLSRDSEKRGGDKRPQLSDLKHSGAIEENADMVLFLHRPEYYGEMTDEQGNSTEGKGEIIIAKHRNGRIGSGWYDFNGSFMRWSDLTESYNHNNDLPF